MSRVGYNITSEWLNAIRSYEGIGGAAIDPLQKKIDVLNKHSKNLSKLLQIIYRDKSKADEKKGLDYRSDPEIMNLIDAVAEGSTYSFDPEDNKPQSPVIPPHTYSWHKDDIDHLIQSLNEEAKRANVDISPLMHQISYEVEKMNRITEAGAKGVDRAKKELEFIIANSR